MDQRRAARRRLLVDAGYELFGTEGEGAVTVRAVSRAARLHTRYFYENFSDTDGLLGAVFDSASAALEEYVRGAITPDPGPELRRQLILRSMLEFCSADHRRGRVLFTEARANPVLLARREMWQQQLVQEVLELNAAERPTEDPYRVRVGAAMLVGAVVELVQEWITGQLGSDLDVVVAHATELSLPLMIPFESID
ncbi:TetR/AcrR family transcriptional regulator [Nocardia coffeae]|uniref:TetR/AcrR family transcriptional regulator n=1 Tax=Nocardia coffeae TaxID=2873381 RepID=UPI001F47354A|nr:TetR/AcrR family transcriptional regulator [Nocardia coffeae]